MIERQSYNMRRPVYQQGSEFFILHDILWIHYPTNFRNEFFMQRPDLVKSATSWFEACYNEEYQLITTDDLHEYSIYIGNRAMDSFNRLRENVDITLC